MGYRNRMLASKAWHQRKHCYANRACQRDFKAGFMQGYIDVAEGGNGCVPAVAPSEYLGWRYQSADGQQSINSWFAGYPLGAQVAQQEGVGNWSSIRPTGAQARQQRQAVFVPSPIDETQSMNGNPFYQDSKSNNQYPYEPVQDDATNRGGNELNLDESPADPRDVRDAIRRALEGPADGDSTSIRNFTPAIGSASFDEPAYEPLDSDPVHMVISSDESGDTMAEVIRSQTPSNVSPVNNNELEYTFE